MRVRTWLLCGTAALGAVAVGGTTAQARKGLTPSVGAVGSLRTVRPDGTVTGTPSASISATRNEFESFQVVIDGGVTGLANARVTLASRLTGPGGALPARSVRIYREGYVDIKTPSDLEGAPGRWPDPLIPEVDPFYHEHRNAFPIDVPPNENRVAWVDVLVPRNAKPGSYHGTLAVRGVGFTRQVPVDLTVWGFRLPSTDLLKSSFGLYPDPCIVHYGRACPGTSKRGWELHALYTRAALDDRVSISSPFGTPRTWLERRRFRRYMLPLLRGTNAGPAASTPSLRGARLTSLAVLKSGALRTWRKEGRRGGFGGRVFFYTCDEPGSDVTKWRHCRRRARRSRRAWPNVASLITATIGAAKAHHATGLVDTLVPSVYLLDGKPGLHGRDHRNDYNAFLRRQGHSLWIYNACGSYGCAAAGEPDPYYAGWPSYAIDQPATEQRAMGTLAFENNATGELYYDTTLSLGTAWTDQFAFGGNGDGNLFYPGTPRQIGGRHDIPIDSIRLKRIRDGHEDYDYMALAAKHGHARRARLIAHAAYPGLHATDVAPAVVGRLRDRLAALIMRSRASR